MKNWLGIDPKTITEKQYSEARAIVDSYELHQLVKKFSCHCKMIGRHNPECEFLRELHDDNEVCTRQMGDPLPEWPACR